MSAPPYMKLYVADYLGDTHHLGALEHGAYLLLLMAMWRAGGSLPAADANLARLARCTADQWAEIRDVILPFFRRRGGRITHKRIAQEMAKYENTSGKRSEAGKRGASEKANRNNASAAANAASAESNCTHNQNQNQNQNQKEEERVEGAQVLPFAAEVGGQAASPRRASRIKADWRPSADNVAFGIAQGFSEEEVQRIAAKFRDHCTEADNRRPRPSVPAKKVDWC
jgi:uncharacterized protein YdaU (DUF1376 family)